MFRRRIVSRLVGRVKEFSGADLPIISELPLLAEEAYQESFSPRGLMEDMELPQGFLDGFLQIPSLCWGRSFGEEAGRLYRVNFDKTLTSPSVVCVGEARGGSISRRDILRVKMPDLKDIPRTVLYWWNCRSCRYSWLAVASASWGSCPECRSSNIYRAQISEETSEEMMNNLYWWAARKGLGDWTVAFNWLRDTIIWAFQWLGRAMGRIVMAIFSGLTEQIDFTRDRINETVQDNFNALMGQVDVVEDRVNLRLDDLYEMWGIPKNRLITPLHVQSVTSVGFEFLSLGNTTAHWIAIGK